MTVDGASVSDQVIFVTGSYDHTIKIWQAHTGMCQRTVQHTESQVNALDITPDKYVIAAAGYQHIRMYDLASNNPNPVINYDGITKNVTGLGFQEEGKWMYTGGEDCSARIWDLRTSSFQCQRIFQVSAPVNCVSLHPNQAELIVGDQSGLIHLWDLRSDHNEQLIPEAEASIQDIAIDPDGTYMAAVNNKGHCFVWALTGGVEEEPTRLNPRHRIEAHNRYALRCKFSPDSTLLVTTSADQTARIWKTMDFSEVQVLQHDAKRWVWDAAFSADSQYVFTASSDGVARLWNIESGIVERKYEGHQKAITALAFRDEILSPS
ncbi:target of rapamycin complex subunit lst8 [Belonocnema kinseyi]|uniref:target of rapamycin complex subunit lst8 n=1 Tax=Belonocnema kinseyi TaxID=2817044 RepID=UPI00143D7EC2|nr:target of rapamycin complex subunit lst8 [Belonocnema kinseyi]XP_033226193.1 target of rapamycin complex subunit lst8 [Belonocnema kinseyi]XP_033226194.1 target of rapamycin complex subunit lst8 [Belonocnema kinseyi]